MSSLSASPANAAVLGCGRSGTSIFGELFAALPGFRYWSEPFLADLPTGGPPDHESWAVKVPRTAAGRSTSGLSTSLAALDPPFARCSSGSPASARCHLFAARSASPTGEPPPSATGLGRWRGGFRRASAPTAWATINGQLRPRRQPGSQSLRGPDRRSELCGPHGRTRERRRLRTRTSPPGVDRVQDTSNDRFIEAGPPPPLPSRPPPPGRTLGENHRRPRSRRRTIIAEAARRRLRARGDQPAGRRSRWTHREQPPDPHCVVDHGTVGMWWGSARHRRRNRVALARRHAHRPLRGAVRHQRTQDPRRRSGPGKRATAPPTGSAPIRGDRIGVRGPSVDPPAATSADGLSIMLSKTVGTDGIRAPQHRDHRHLRHQTAYYCCGHQRQHRGGDH